MDWNNKKSVMYKLRREPFDLHQASPELQADIEVVGLAVTKEGNALMYASEELRDNEELVLLAMKTNFRAYTMASERVKNISAVKSLYKKLKI